MNIYSRTGHLQPLKRSLKRSVAQSALADGTPGVFLGTPAPKDGFFSTTLTYANQRQLGCLVSSPAAALEALIADVPPSGNGDGAS